MKLHLSLITAAVLCACGGNVQDNREQTEQMRRVDSLWGNFKGIKELLRYDVYAIHDRKEEMDSLLQISKFFNETQLDEGEKQILLGYAAIARVYAPIAPKYKEVVLESEEAFYRIKAMEQSVRNQTYIGKRDESIAAYQRELAALEHLEEDGKNVLNKLTEVEPMYLRLQPAVEEIMERETKLIR